MISTAKFVKMLSYDDKQLDEAIKNIPPEDARDFLRFTVKFLQQRDDKADYIDMLKNI